MTGKTNQKDGRYDYIETGYLISIRENVKDILIPSEEESLTMYPMDFEEFSDALGESMIIPYIKECFDKKAPLLDSIHKKALFLFIEYMLVGGMPQVVSAYVENKGMFFENIIAQMLTANGHKLYFYNRFSDEKHRNEIEIDFIITTKDRINPKIIPIEVKSSKNYTTTSLIKFNERYKNRIIESYIIHPKNLSIRDDGVICIPAYMTFCLV